MNKAKLLYEAYLKITGDPATAKKCVEIFLDETNKFLITEYKKHTAQWWFFRLAEIKEDLQHINL